MYVLKLTNPSVANDRLHIAPKQPRMPLRNSLAHLCVAYPLSSSTLRDRVFIWRDFDVPLLSGWKTQFWIVTVGGGERGEGQGKPGAVGLEKNVQNKVSLQVADLAPMMVLF